MHRYIAFLCWGVADTGMKNMVLVLGAVPYPCARWCISVALDACHSKPIRTIAEFLVFCKLACIWIEGIAMECSIWC